MELIFIFFVNYEIEINEEKIAIWGNDWMII